MSELSEALYGGEDKASERLGYLERYYDPAALIPEREISDWEQDQVDRISTALAIVITAGSIVRRLGAEATREELALDKKRSKRVGHALSSSLFAWHRKSPKLPASPEIRVAGAQLNWDVFVPEHLATAQDLLIKMASWSIRNGEHRWGRSVVTRIENEVKWINYAMRD